MYLDLDIVDAYERRFGKKAAFDQALHFMQSYMELMKHQLPSEASTAVAAAKRALGDQATGNELEDARINCQKFLDETDPWGNNDDPRVSATKAAMRLLFRDPDDSDTIDIVGYFLKMANAFEDHSGEGILLLARYFSD